MMKKILEPSLFASRSFVFLLALAGFLSACTKEEKADSSPVKLSIYTSRSDHLIRPIVELYEKETGVEVSYMTDKAGALLERLKAEGENTSADILMTVDAGNLWQAVQMDLLQPVESATLEKNIPAAFREPKGHWFGFSGRARTIFYHPERVNASELSSYEDLASEKWKGRLCLRSSSSVYNQSLVAALISHYGKEKTEQVVSGWVANLATEPFANDTSLLKAIAAGQCDVGLANSYYYGRLVKEETGFPVKIFWAQLDSAGTHMNVSGAGVTKHSKQPEAAKEFLEWLSTQAPQKLFAELNMEFPLLESVEKDPIVASWGDFKADLLNIKKVGELQSEAVQLMDRAQYR